MTSCNKAKIDWSSEVSFLLLRNYNSSGSLSPSLNQKNGSILQLNSENQVITVLRSNAGKSGSISLTPKPTRRNGKSGSFAISMTPTNKWELVGALYRRNSTGTISFDIGLRIASRTASMAPSGTIFGLFLVILIQAEHAIISKSANSLLSSWQTSIVHSTVIHFLFRLLIHEGLNQSHHLWNEVYPQQKGHGWKN